MKVRDNKEKESRLKVGTLKMLKRGRDIEIFFIIIMMFLRFWNKKLQAQFDEADEYKIRERRSARVNEKRGQKHQKISQRLYKFFLQIKLA